MTTGRLKESGAIPGVCRISVHRARHGATVSTPVPGMSRGGGDGADEGMAEMRIQAQVGSHRTQQRKSDQCAGEGRPPPGVESGHAAQALSEGTEDEKHGAQPGHYPRQNLEKAGIIERQGQALAGTLDEEHRAVARKQHAADKSAATQ